MSQSSNDTFPTALHIAAVCALEGRVLPALEALGRRVCAGASGLLDLYLSEGGSDRKGGVVCLPAEKRKMDQKDHHRKDLNRRKQTGVNGL